MKIAIRADASAKIGTGHVMRCLTLAKALRERGAECRFICRAHPGHMLDQIREAHFEAVCLPRANRIDRDDPEAIESSLPYAHCLKPDPQTDAIQTLVSLRDYCADWLIVDHYELDYRWESQLRPYCRKIMVIDDLADRNHDCDLLLDQNLVANWSHRYTSHVPQSCGCLLGPRYALLQSEYAEFHPRTPPRLGPIQRVLVYFGGADSQNLTSRTINAFLELQRHDITLDVVINPSSLHAATVRKQVKGYSNIKLHEHIPSLAPLMLMADVAVGAGGATSWERCCLGLPTLVVTLADNQRPIAEELSQRGLVCWVGGHELITSEDLKNALSEILRNEDQLAAWSMRCRELLDGRGCEEVVEVLLLNAETELVARPASLEDESLILQWVNDPIVRKNAFNTNPIDACSHRMWFYERLRQIDDYRIYIIETKNGLPIGQVRFERSKQEWEIHYCMAAIARGRGLGAPLVRTAINALLQSDKNASVFGRVKVNNLPSRKVFAHLGFEAIGGNQEEIVFRSQPCNSR